MEIQESDLDGYYELVMKLVQDAGDLLESKYFMEQSFVAKSSNIDLVTETDQQVEKLLTDGIQAVYPNHKFIGEEATSEDNKKVELTDDPTWCIDPVDGTMNFVHNFPHSCISIALYVNKITQIGIVYNPVLKQKFTARLGKGAFYSNGQTNRQISVSGQTDLSQALVTTEFGTSRDEEKTTVVCENISRIVRKVHGIRSLGAAALNLSMVALGCIDINYEFGLHIWDIAAADLIVREAGGVVMDPSGGPLDLLSRRVLAASTQTLADEFSPLLTQFYPQPRD